MSQNKIDPSTFQRIQKWLEGPYDSKTKEEIRNLLAHDEKSLSDAFFRDLSFGTGGMRGLMGVGTNRMNIYTIQKATQGLANYVKKQTHGPLSVFIGYDVRHHSKEFAIETGKVLAGNGFKVFLSKEICPTPLVSFGCRFFQCNIAIMITASHNPPQYNGYKVYWKDGAQVVSPHDLKIIEEVEKIENDIHIASIESPLIHWVGEELDTAYLEQIKTLQLHPMQDESALKILYTPLHGTGIRILPKALESWGYRNVHLVEKQSFPDGSFSNAPVPNPEDPRSLVLGMDQLRLEKGDILIATDPDADRIGVVENGSKPFTGNQVACLLLYHICESLKKKRTFPLNATFVKTIVTTELFKKIAENYGGICVDVLTGFKYIGEKISEWEQNPGKNTYVFGAEESCGYLFGSFVRDKDAISTACLISECALLAKQKQTNLKSLLYSLYHKYGIHRELLANFAFSDSLQGIRQMKDRMDFLRKHPPQEILGKKVVLIEDYLLGLNSFPSSDALRIWLSDSTKLVLRPSGTEPKMKLYIEVTENSTNTIEDQIKSCDERLLLISNTFQKQYFQ